VGRAGREAGYVVPTNTSDGAVKRSERVTLTALTVGERVPRRRQKRETMGGAVRYLPGWKAVLSRARNSVNKVITMPERSGHSAPRLSGVRDRRYTLRYPFAADAQVFDLETGKMAEGVTSDISMGGCFICTSKPLPVGTRGRLKLTRKGQTLEALVVVRIVKPRIGMGIEFFDVEEQHSDNLANWIETLRRSR
jgi:PilZ domain